MDELAVHMSWHPLVRVQPTPPHINPLQTLQTFQNPGWIISADYNHLKNMKTKQKAHTFTYNHQPDFSQQKKRSTAHLALNSFFSVRKSPSAVDLPLTSRPLICNKDCHDALSGSRSTPYRPDLSSLGHERNKPLLCHSLGSKLRKWEGEPWRTTL